MKLIIIIDAEPGINQGVARRFGKEGFKIAFITRSESKLKGLAKDGGLAEQLWSVSMNYFSNHLTEDAWVKLK
jgi:short-subunit dehydrogenase